MAEQQQQQRSSVLPSDPFEVALDKLIGVPNGAHTGAAVTQAKDFYGNVTTFIVQTVKHSEGHSVFITQVNSQGSARFVLGPEVMAVINRQAASVVTQVRRRVGQRLAEERKAEGGLVGGFTPAMRAKAAATRKANAAKRAARRKGVRA
jgi:hypothetical protein